MSERESALFYKQKHSSRRYQINGFRLEKVPVYRLDCTSSQSLAKRSFTFAVREPCQQKEHHWCECSQFIRENAFETISGCVCFLSCHVGHCKKKRGRPEREVESRRGDRRTVTSKGEEGTCSGADEVRGGSSTTLS